MLPVDGPAVGPAGGRTPSGGVSFPGANPLVRDAVPSAFAARSLSAERGAPGRPAPGPPPFAAPGPAAGAGTEGPAGAAEADSPAPFVPDDLRGANQSLVGGFSSACGSAAAASCTMSGRGVLPVRSLSRPPAEDAPEDPLKEPPDEAAEASASLIGVRMTTGGIGREPGMLIRMRVVTVVSVLGSSGCGSGAAPASSGASCGGCSDGYWRDPYGGVPEGYTAPPRPWGPEDELSVSRLKAGSPGWLRRPFLTG